MTIIYSLISYKHITGQTFIFVEYFFCCNISPNVTVRLGQIHIQNSANSIR